MAPSRHAWLLCAIVAGCTEAQYDTPDADAGSQRESDAAAPKDSGPDAPWFASLADRYAISIRFYSLDHGLADQAHYSHEIIMLASISHAGERVYMDAQRCSDHGNALGLGLQDDFWWPHATKLPPQHFELVQRADGIRTEAPPRRIGFTEQPPMPCTPGTQLKLDGRPWLPNGMCDCRADELPMLVTDCRVTDDDGDGAAGITVQHMGLLNDPERARALDSCQITQAQLSADGRMQGYFIENYDFLSLGCGQSPCSQAAIASCPLMLNPVLFEPVEEPSWTCDDVMNALNAGKLFPPSMLTFVKGC